MLFNYKNEQSASTGNREAMQCSKFFFFPPWEMLIFKKLKWQNYDVKVMNKWNFGKEIKLKTINWECILFFLHDRAKMEFDV